MESRKKMKKTRKILVSVIAMILLLSFLVLTFHINNHWKSLPLTGYDGPYIYVKEGYIEEINVIKGKKNKYVLHRQIYDSIPNQFFCQVDNEDGDNFYFSLQNETIIDSSYYNMPSKMIVISAIHGNFNGLYSFLLSNKVIDTQYNWIFDDGHLVLLGDFMGRGHNVIPILWLIYKLEQEALTFGGKVHYILGNHELMNINNQIDYVNNKYFAIAQRYANKKNNKKAYRELLANNFFVDWLKTKNIATIIGNYLFVHGGISPDLLATGFSIDSINNIGRKNEYNDQNHDLMFGYLGPLWYRGMVDGRQYTKLSYSKMTEDQVDEVLKRYNVAQIVIGHTIMSDISYDFNCKVLRIDIGYGQDKFSGKTLGILIENNMIYKINDLGEKFRIE